MCTIEQAEKQKLKREGKRTNGESEEREKEGEIGRIDLAKGRDIPIRNTSFLHL